MFKRRSKIGPASVDQKKLHGSMIKVLYGRRNDSQVTPLGVYAKLTSEGNRDAH